MNLSKKIMDKKVYLFSVIIAIIIIGGYYYLNMEEKEFHIHADFKVFINGNPINFSHDKYQSYGSKQLHPTVHLHDNNGNVIHFHEEGINLSTFFKSLSINLSDSCIVFENISYCSNSTHKLEFYINDEKVESIHSYVASDLDGILIAYDSIDIDTSIYLDQVTDEACIQSALCPERGEPSEGSCISGEVCEIEWHMGH